MTNYFNVQNLKLLITLRLTCFILITTISVGFLSRVEAQTNNAKEIGFNISITYSDGTPLALSSSNKKYLDLDYSKDLGATGWRISQNDDGSYRIWSMVKGDYILKFMDMVLAQFSIYTEGDKLVTDCPPSIILPFNFLVEGEPNAPALLLNEDMQTISSFTFDSSGYLFVTQNLNELSDKILSVSSSNGFPQVQVIKPIKEKDIRAFSSRRISVTSKPINLKSGGVHLRTTDTYYKLEKLKFSDKTKTMQYLIKSYNSALGKGSIQKLQLPEELKKMFIGSIGLDYLGNMMIKVGNDFYQLDPGGSIQLRQDYNKHGYQFNNHFVKESSWIIPTWMGIALTEGTHKETVSCTGKWSEQTPESKAWNENLSEVGSEIAELWEVIQKTNEPSDRYNELLILRDSLVRNPPKQSFTDHEGTISSTQTFSINFTPEEGYPWTKEVIEEHDPESKIFVMEIEECYIQLDGGAQLKYWYEDIPYQGGVYHSYDDDGNLIVDEEANKPRASLGRKMGFSSGEEGGSNEQGYNLDFLRNGPIKNVSTRPLNLSEGPYPELRYSYREVTGTYPSMKEARKHCKSPYRAKDKYNCYEDKVLTVCLDNYSFINKDGRFTTDYEALYCQKEVVIDPSKGEEIVIEFSAKGYLPATRALQKRDLEIGNYKLSGVVKSKSDSFISGATVRIKGKPIETVTDDNGAYELSAFAGGTESHTEVMDIRLQAIGIEVSNEELGVYKDKPFGVVADGFTTLKLKVKASGIRPQTVSVKTPELGDFVEQSSFKVPLALNSNGEGEMEFVPPAYLSEAQLTKHLKIEVADANQYGLSKQIWVAEVPIDITYEDEEGNPGTFTFKIHITRPPIFLIHGFTGDETTWATLANYLRTKKYEPIIREYYQGPADESTIERQSQKIGFYIQKLRECYLDNNIVQTRIDIVAHSMGGLMSRHYINNMSKYGEKAGVFIPYDVKLSREELAQARSKKEVKLVDVRKLIMVGTPNHGASPIDEIFGTLGAVTSDYHQVANGQLRSDSQFFKELNEGENEGRHLDQNVQYALLYGIRKRSEFYPADRLFYPWQTSQKNFADDDGVVKTSSAVLNGILNIPFPKDWFAMHGYIHSPAVEPFFMGDESITESMTIFEEVNYLLQKDIARTPLKNSFSKIVRAEGETFMKYFANEDWKPLNTPLNRNSAIKLRDNWCKLKTNEGSVSLAFYLDGHHWGSLNLENNTIVYYEYASPEFVKVYVEKGRARFRSRKQNGGGFEVVLGDEGEKWYEFNPKAKVRDINTDFTVEKNESVSIQSLGGSVTVGITEKTETKIVERSLSDNKAIKIISPDNIVEFEVPETGWWSDMDTSYIDDIDDEVELTTRTNLIVNGDFEESASVGYYRTVRSGETIPGWKIDNASVDLTGTYFDAAKGKVSIDLVGTPGFGSISQQIQTTPGSVYKLTFMLAGNPAGGPSNKSLTVSASGQQSTFSFDITGKSIHNMGWESKTWTFRAQEEETNLVFTANEFNPPTNYGPAIDDIQLYEVEEDEWDESINQPVKPFQEIGYIRIMPTTTYLPVSGFSELNLTASNIEGTTLSSPYEVTVSILNNELVPFIEIAQSEGIIDEEGKFNTPVLMNEPNPDDFNSLTEIPLEIQLKIELRNPQTGESPFDSLITMPLGITLISGTTVGPNFDPRQEPLPPEFFDPSYQLANQADEVGNFTILFNTSLFEQDVDRFKKLAERKQELFSIDDFDFTLEWSQTSSIPLCYKLSTSDIKQFKPGTKVVLRKDKGFDLLTPEEHEERFRSRLVDFTEGLSLGIQRKTALLKSIKQINFEYGAHTEWKAPSIKMNAGIPYIFTPTAPDIFWTVELSSNEAPSTYVAVWHAAGHVLYELLLSTNNNHYKFLEGHCNTGESNWTHILSEEEIPFDQSEYISFYEAGADFFAYKMLEFLNKNKDPLLSKSMYTSVDYLSDFDTIEKAINTKKRYPGHLVSGPQTSFLVEYYKQINLSDPDISFEDFLKTHLLQPRGLNTSTTFTDWLNAQMTVRPQPSTSALADSLGLIKNVKGIKLIPLEDIGGSTVKLNGRVISDFTNIPLIEIQDTVHIEVIQGLFELQRIKENNLRSARLYPGSHVYLRRDQNMDCLQGPVWTNASCTLNNKLATITGSRFNCYIDTEEEDMIIYVLDGQIKLTSEKNEKEAEALKYLKINKKGRIKRAKDIDNDVLSQILDRVNKQFIIDNPFVYENEITEELGTNEE